ncbi:MULTISPECIES: hypothetical protein [unclassified Brenneria]|uniref:hypothetical protein n=1 Tax=unclassified Brenneria TaxID=2634434 RepID=UPI0018F07D00|nr:hypothetical protein [Brenneria sp. L3-3C-1]MBJ7224038.1 hypothetical protein [Brenneria sp. L3-3C-1]MEE3645282.1 hypothetical protein [Brenneria sp. L3_3C_1]
MNNANPKYAALIGLLSAFDDNVVTDEDYELIKNSDINDDVEQMEIINRLLVPWFKDYSSEAKSKIIQVLDYAVNNINEVDGVFNQVDFVFDCEIVDKEMFLVRIRSILDKYT